jgi:hypothetical protein
LHADNRTAVHRMARGLGSVDMGFPWLEKRVRMTRPAMVSDGRANATRVERGAAG